MMLETAASYEASEAVLIGVSPHAHEPEQSRPVVTSVQSPSVEQAREKLDGLTSTHAEPSGKGGPESAGSVIPASAHPVGERQSAHFPAAQMADPGYAHGPHVPCGIDATSDW
jgi:hypothetical protein